MPQALSFAAVFAIASFGAPRTAPAQALAEPPFAVSLPAPEEGIPALEMLLAQASAASAPEAAPAAAPASATPAAGEPSLADSNAARTQAPPRHQARTNTDFEREDWERKRVRFRDMQKTGFGLMMGGIGAGAGGLVLMINGIANAETHRDYYGNTETREPGPTFWIGYISFFVAFPPLLTTGIILNRIGNHKRQTYERLLETAGRTRLDLGPDSFRLTYSF